MKEGFIVNNRFFIESVECTARECKLYGLPKEVIDLCVEKISVYIGKGEFYLMSRSQYEEYLDQKSGKEKVDVDHCECIYDKKTQRALFLALFHAVKAENRALPAEVEFKVQFSKTTDYIVMRITNYNDLRGE